jgi:hypothetical protein
MGDVMFFLPTMIKSLAKSATGMRLALKTEGAGAAASAGLR